jgi:hypothetical protein
LKNATITREGSKDSNGLFEEQPYGVITSIKYTHTLSTKLSTTRFSPAWSNLMVSLLPSTAVTPPRD